jgi:predicted TIM-barrel fold metal-dependent hydrolase
MSRFVFSADGHVKEPQDLFTQNLPASLREHSIYIKKEGDFLLTCAGDNVLFRFAINRPPRKDGFDFGRPNQKGGVDLDARLEDMAMEGIDAEIVFPTLGMMTFLLTNREAELASCQVYNDWLTAFVGDRTDTFVRSGVLPVHHFEDTVLEMERIAKQGYTSVMLPSYMPAGVPGYTDPSWDPVFDAAQRLGQVVTLHTATGRDDVRPARGPGAAVINYTCQMLDAQRSIMEMVAGGLLDRFPQVQVAIIESGASWLAGLSERLDECYHGHYAFVQPKLSVPPSEIIKRQINVSFQYDRGCIMSRSVTGTKGLMWGSDYPHHEGTFPNSRKVLAELFDGIDISEQEKADIVGGNAARLFRLPRPEFALAA